MIAFDIEDFVLYEIGFERGFIKGFEIGIKSGEEAIIGQLLLSLSPEQIAKLTDLPLEKILKIKNKTEH